jgi:class 3 adenylate cyclase
MQSHTYLPSYYQTDTKRVTLVCVEIRDFDRAATILRQRYDFDEAKRTQCLRGLVNRFNEIATRIVEKYHGRVDQVWGSGIVAVFGEYLDTQDASPRPGCKRALTMAAEFVQEFQIVAADWLKTDFCMEKYEGEYNAFVNVSPAVALDHGEVFFDYVGSPSHRVYMALGDRVDFIRQLAGVAGRIIQDNTHTHSHPDMAGQQARSGVICWLPEYQGPPILLSQPVHKWAKDILLDQGGSPTGEVHVPFLISLPGRSERFPVYGIRPENVVRVTP